MLCFNFVLVVDYDEVLRIGGKWLFWNIPIFPAKKKDKGEKPGKGKKKRGKKPAAAKEPAAETPPGEGAPPDGAEPAEAPAAQTPPADTKPAAAPKGKKAKSPLVIFYENTGFDGVMNLLHGTADALGGLFRGLLRHLVVRELFIDLLVTGSDAADTAVRYGKVCQKVWPTLGFLCANMRVRRYDMDIHPDFLGGKDKARYHLVFSMRPLPVLGILLLAVLRLAVRVLLKFLLHARPPKAAKKKAPPAPLAGEAEAVS